MSEYQDVPNGSNKWKTIRWVMRGLAVGIVPVIAVTPPGVLLAVLTGVAMGLGAMTVNMPVDHKAYIGPDRRKK